ncbi:MAG: hypothetical protein WCR98_07895, partial [Saccharofermentanales bacterium]
EDYRDAVSKALTIKPVGESQDTPIAEVSAPVVPVIKGDESFEQAWLKSIAKWKNLPVTDLEYADILEAAKAHFELKQSKGVASDNVITAIEKIEAGELPALFVTLPDALDSIKQSVLSAGQALNEVDDAAQLSAPEVDAIVSFGEQSTKDTLIEKRTEIELLPLIDQFIADGMGVEECLSRTSAILSDEKKKVVDEGKVSPLLNEQGEINATAFEHYYQSVSKPNIEFVNIEPLGVTASYIKPLAVDEGTATVKLDMNLPQVREVFEKRSAEYKEAKSTLDSYETEPRKKIDDLVGYRVAKAAEKVKLRAMNDAKATLVINEVIASDEATRNSFKDDVARLMLSYPQVAAMLSRFYPDDLLKQRPSNEVLTLDLDKLNYSIPGLKDENPLSQSLLAYARKSGTGFSTFYMGENTGNITPDTLLYSLEFGETGLKSLKSWSVKPSDGFEINDYFYFSDAGVASFLNIESRWKEALSNLLTKPLILSNKDFETTYRVEESIQLSERGVLSDYIMDLPSSIKTSKPEFTQDLNKALKSINKLEEELSSKQQFAYELAINDGGARLRSIEREREGLSRRRRDLQAGQLMLELRNTHGDAEVIRKNYSDLLELSNEYPELNDELLRFMPDVQDLALKADFARDFVRLSPGGALPGLKNKSPLHDKINSLTSEGKTPSVVLFKTQYSIAIGGEMPVVMDFYGSGGLRSLSQWEYKGSKWVVSGRYSFDPQGRPISLSKDEVKAYIGILESIARDEIKVVAGRDISALYEVSQGEDHPKPISLHNTTARFNVSKSLGYNQYGLKVYEDAVGRFIADAPVIKQNADGTFDLSGNVIGERVFRAGNVESRDFIAGDFLIARKDSDTYREDLLGVAKGLAYACSQGVVSNAEMLRYLTVATGESKEALTQTPTMHLFQEMIESAMVEQVRDAVASHDIESLYLRTAQLLSNQPTLNAQTANSINLQQYSTPLPLSVLMGDLMNVGDYESVIEPTAGNGSLLSMIKEGAEITAY